MDDCESKHMFCNNENIQAIICVKSNIAIPPNHLPVAKWLGGTHVIPILSLFSITSIEVVAKKKCKAFLIHGSNGWKYNIMGSIIHSTTLSRT